MDREELHKSIQAYEEQLEQVKKTLEITGNNEERKSLESLKNDLIELIELTLQTIEQDETQNDSNEQQCQYESSESSSDKNTSLFLSRVKNLEEISLDIGQQNQSISDEDYEQKLQCIKDELKNMIGEKCSAPHNHSWGSIVYHNAIICGLEESCDYELSNIKNFRIRVLFTNPTHREMIPCPYFLEGECKFNADKCHFSHGELIAIGELKDYQTPDFTKLIRNCVVLAKLDDRMWHKGKVICSNFNEKSCRIRINGQRNEIDLKFEDLFPIFHENEDSSSNDDNDDDSIDGNSSDSNDSDSSEIRDKKIIERTLLNPVSNQPLGDWEKHTRGIGSKLMKKMGYVFGAGLGSAGEGIVAPIIAQILPPGRSLDYCMELRELSSDGDNLFSLEKKLKKEQQQTERLNRNNENSRKKQQNNDVFSFLNDNILSARNLDMGKETEAGNKQKNKISNNLNDFRNQSTKKLNIEGVKIGDEIRKKEKEITKIKESMKRHSIGTDIYERLKIQFNCKNHELENLKQSECKLNKEQISRKKLDESFVF